MKLLFSGETNQVKTWWVWWRESTGGRGQGTLFGVAGMNKFLASGGESPPFHPRTENPVV